TICTSARCEASREVTNGSCDSIDRIASTASLRELRLIRRRRASERIGSGDGPVIDVDATVAGAAGRRTGACGGRGQRSSAARTGPGARSVDVDVRVLLGRGQDLGDPVAARGLHRGGAVHTALAG